MDPSLRVVTSWPLNELWDDRRAVPAQRIRDVGSDQIRQLLREGEVQFVYHEGGGRLRWVRREARYRFWKEELAPHVIEPSLPAYVLDDLPDGYGYVCSEWRASAGDAPIILAEMAH